MVYIFLADGFEEIEALATVDILRRCKIDVTTASIMEGLSVEGAHGIIVEADVIAEHTGFSDLEAIVLPGGLPGADHLQSSPLINALLKQNFGAGKLIAAICAAPKILGAAGLLDGKRATCFPGFEKQLKGAKFSEDRVVQDGNIITSRGAGTAHGFAFAIAAALGKQREAAAVRESMLYDISL